MSIVNSIRAPALLASPFSRALLCELWLASDDISRCGNLATRFRENLTKQRIFTNDIQWKKKQPTGGIWQQKERRTKKRTLTFLPNKEEVFDVCSSVKYLTLASRMSNFTAAEFTQKIYGVEKIKIYNIFVDDSKKFQLPVTAIKMEGFLRRQQIGPRFISKEQTSNYLKQ